MANQTITLTLSAEESSRLLAAWQEFKTEKTPPYALFQLRPENCVITCYTSGKTVFQGADAHIYAAPFQPHDMILPQAGSDEVGTGDYFGPVCVCAAVITENDRQLLHDCMVQDSKSLTDKQIRAAAPLLREHLLHSLLVVMPDKYNEVHARYNMNAVKAMLHNQAYVNLAKKAPLPAFRVIDQFTPETSYYRYLRTAPEVIRDIHFETKAEDKYPAVGAASMIARLAFLEVMDKMEAHYEMKFQKGAGSLVDACAREFADRYGFERLHEVAKLHFKNTGKLQEPR
ncbi:MAG: ribonuclease HIII [Solobacterium sp.]|nr:ribonuclease HIII [Solobacterium sp.]